MMEELFKQYYQRDKLPTFCFREQAEHHFDDVEPTIKEKGESLQLTDLPILKEIDA